MRLTIIRSDGFVSVNNEGFSDLDLSFMDSDIHAVQWYGTEGEIERKDSRGRIVANEEITSIEQFQQAVDVWGIAKQMEQEALQAQAFQEQGAN
jgi:hypothetical protein